MRNKFNAQKVVRNGVKSASKAEYRRYQELLLLQHAGEISQLETQVPFEIIPAQYEPVARYGAQGKRLKDGKRCVEKSVVYYADFTYRNKNGEYIVEDVKGYTDSTAYRLFVIKRKLMLQVHGIRVQEIKY